MPQECTIPGKKRFTIWTHEFLIDDAYEVRLIAFLEKLTLAYLELRNSFIQLAREPFFVAGLPPPSVNDIGWYV